MGRISTKETRQETSKTNKEMQTHTKKVLKEETNQILILKGSPITPVLS